MKFARELRLAAALAMSVGAGCFAVTTANAITYDLNIDHCTGGCGSGTLAQVSVVQNGANVDFTVTALAGTVFNLNGAGLDTFLFGFSGTALTAASFANLQTGFAAVIPAGHQDGFGDFLYGVNANGGTFAGPLTFTILNESLGNLVASTGNGTSVLFAADLLGNGNTGLVGGNDICLVNCGTGGGNAGGTPLPAALPLFGSVLGGGFFFSKWRRKRRAA
jgi:hypothetical protein